MFERRVRTKEETLWRTRIWLCKCSRRKNTCGTWAQVIPRTAGGLRVGNRWWWDSPETFVKLCKLAGLLLEETQFSSRSGLGLGMVFLDKRSQWTLCSGPFGKPWILEDLYRPFNLKASIRFKASLLVHLITLSVTGNEPLKWIFVPVDT